jgi:hypothetical protein
MGTSTWDTCWIHLTLEGLQSGATRRCLIRLPLQCHSTLIPGSVQQCEADMCAIYTLAKQWRDCSDQRRCNLVTAAINLLSMGTLQCGHKCPVYVHNGYHGRVPFDT